MTDDSCTGGTGLDLVKCTMCLNWMKPFNPVAEAHICRTCLDDIQIGDRHTDAVTDGGRNDE